MNKFAILAGEVSEGLTSALQKYGVRIVSEPPTDPDDLFYGVGRGAGGLSLARQYELDKLLLIAPFAPPNAQPLHAFHAPVLAYAFDDGIAARHALSLFRSAKTELRIHSHDDVIYNAAVRWLTDTEPTEIA